jgi:hypothetical protein
MKPWPLVVHRMIATVAEEPVFDLVDEVSRVAEFRSRLTTVMLSKIYAHINAQSQRPGRDRKKAEGTPIQCAKKNDP